MLPLNHQFKSCFSFLCPLKVSLSLFYGDIDNDGSFILSSYNDPGNIETSG